MILWPTESEFPQRVVTDGYQFSFAEGRINSTMSRGFAKTRGNALGAPRAIPCHLMLPTALLARLERFWNEDTGGGNLWFVIPDQTFDNEQLVDEFGAFIFDQFGAPLTQTS